MEATYNARAHEFLAQAEKKLKGSFFSNLLSNKSERLEEAGELYKQAANNFKLAKEWEKAAQAYLKCADCDRQNKSGEAAEYLYEAANMMKKVNSADAIKLMQDAIDLYCQDGRISSAAKLRKQIAESYEADHEYTLAAQNYQEAADLYGMEGEYTSSVNSMLLKVAELKTLQKEGDVVEAIKIYDKVADKYLENKLTAPSSRDLFFRACLLYLTLDDTVGAQNQLEKSVDRDPSFENTREYKFVKALCQAIDGPDLTKFSDECYEYNKIIPLDKWKTTILSRIKGLLEKTVKDDDSVL